MGSAPAAACMDFFGVCCCCVVCVRLCWLVAGFIVRIERVIYQTSALHAYNTNIGNVRTRAMLIRMHKQFCAKLQGDWKPHWGFISIGDSSAQIHQHAVYYSLLNETHLRRLIVAQFCIRKSTSPYSILLHCATQRDTPTRTRTRPGEPGDKTQEIKTNKASNNCRRVKVMRSRVRAEHAKIHRPTVRS